MNKATQQVLNQIDWNQVIQIGIQIIQALRSGQNILQILPLIIELIQLVTNPNPSVKIDWGQVDWEKIIGIIITVIGLFGENQTSKTNAIGSQVVSENF